MYLTTESLYLFTSISLFSPPVSPWQPFFYSLFLLWLFFFFKIPRIKYDAEFPGGPVIKDPPANIYVYIVVYLQRHVWPSYDLMDYSLPGFSVNGISQARILKWVAISFSRESFQHKDQTHVSCTGRRILSYWTTWDFAYECVRVLLFVTTMLWSRCYFIYILEMKGWKLK